MKSSEFSELNIFEQALLARFHMLGVGAPDERIQKAIHTASLVVTEEVKTLLKREYESRRARREQLLEEMR